MVDLELDGQYPTMFLWTTLHGSSGIRPCARQKYTNECAPRTFEPGRRATADPYLPRCTAAPDRRDTSARTDLTTVRRAMPQPGPAHGPKCTNDFRRACTRGPEPGFQWRACIPAFGAIAP